MMALANGRWTAAAILFAVALLAGVLAVSAAEARQPPAQPEPPPADGEAARPQMNQVDPNAPPAAVVEGDEEQDVFKRGPGGGLAVLPAFLWWLLIVGWAATTVWAGTDEDQLKSFTPMWLPILTVPFFFVALAAWWIPVSAAACGLTAAAWLGTLLSYAVLRDRPLPRDRRVVSLQNAVLTAARTAQPLLKRMGIKIDLESRSLAASLPDVEIGATALADAPAPEVRVAEAAALEGFAVFREIVQRCVAMRADQAVIEIGQQGGEVRQLVDGVWHPLRHLVRNRIGLKVVDAWEPAPPLDANEAKQILGIVKTLCSISSKSGRRQTGRFSVGLQRRTIPCDVTLEKGEKGVRLAWEFQPPQPAFGSLEGLGLEPADAAKVKQALALVNSLVLVSAPAREGLTTTFNQILLTADRLLRDFVILEDERTPFREVQNVKAFRWGGAEQLAPVTVLENAMRGYPTALVTPDLEDGPLAVELVKRAGEMLVIVGVRADDACAAVERLVALGAPRADLSKVIQIATGQRLIRRVCPKCAVEYAPSPEMLARLKLPAQEGLMFKRAAEAGCPACSGTGYLGRAALVEIAGGPTVSKAIAKGVDRASFIKAAQSDGMRRFREAGLAMVAAGTTTLEELQRILKKEKA